VFLILHVKAQSGGGYSGKSKIGAEMFFVFLQQKIENEDAQREEQQLHLRQDDQTIAVDEINDRIEEVVHEFPYLTSWLAGTSAGNRWGL
jgi:hypothetical protein